MLPVLNLIESQPQASESWHGKHCLYRLGQIPCSADDYVCKICHRLVPSACCSSCRAASLVTLTVSRNGVATEPPRAFMVITVGRLEMVACSTRS